MKDIQSGFNLYFFQHNIFLSANISKDLFELLEQKKVHKKNLLLGQMLEDLETKNFLSKTFFFCLGNL